jgi:hypothetical protein
VDQGRTQVGAAPLAAGDRVVVTKEGNRHYGRIGRVQEIRDREKFPVIIEFDDDPDSWWGLRRGAVQLAPPERAPKESPMRNDSNNDPRTEEAKFALDQALAGFEGQRNNLLDYQGRAKDVLSLLTLAATFLGAFGKANVDGVLDQLHHRPEWWMWLFIGFPVLTVIATLYVMLPRRGARSNWVFVLNAESIAQSMEHRQPNVVFADNAQLYLAYVGVVSRFLDANTAPLRRRRTALWLAMLFLVGTIATVGILVLSGPPTGGHTQ